MNIKADDTIYFIASYINNLVLICYKFGSIVIFDGKEFRIIDNDNLNLTIRGFYSIKADK
jgi:hypothetical protein